MIRQRGQQRPPRLLADAQRDGQRGGQQVRVAERREIDEGAAVPEFRVQLFSDADGQAGLTMPPSP